LNIIIIILSLLYFPVESLLLLLFPWTVNFAVINSGVKFQVQVDCKSWWKHYKENVIVRRGRFWIISNVTEKWSVK
jgi:hypothetical protein